MKTKNKILVALDLEEQALIALQYAVHFADILDYDVETITVVEESNLFSKLFSSDELIVKMNKDVKAKIENTVEKFRNKVKIHTNIAHGKPYQKIMEFAGELKPSFIFMGKCELSKQNASIIGSNSMHVILEAGFPVVTIRGNFNFETYAKEHKEILLPLDFKKGIAEQVTAAIEFAKLLNTSIRLFSIQTSGGKGREAKMLTQIAHTKKVISDAGISCNAEIITNPEKGLAELICEEAMNRKAAMIIIMTRSESKITDFIIGSKAMEIINKSDIPVVSIEPWDKDSGSEIFSMFFDPLNIISKD